MQVHANVIHARNDGGFHNPVSFFCARYVTNLTISCVCCVGCATGHTTCREALQGRFENPIRAHESQTMDLCDAYPLAHARPTANVGTRT